MLVRLICLLLLLLWKHRLLGYAVISRRSFINILTLIHHHHRVIIIITVTRRRNTFIHVFKSRPTRRCHRRATRPLRHEITKGVQLPFDRLFSIEVSKVLTRVHTRKVLGEFTRRRNASVGLIVKPDVKDIGLSIISSRPNYPYRRIETITFVVQVAEISQNVGVF